MKSALAMILLVLVAGCTSARDIYQLPPQGQKSVQTPAQETPQATATPVAIAPLNVKILFVEVPAKAQQNSKAIVKWKIDSSQQKNITHTAVHYGSKPVPGDLSVDVTPATAGYADLTAISTTSRIPNEFSLPIFTKGAGTIYLRAHVMADDKNYWTEERPIIVE